MKNQKIRGHKRRQREIENWKLRNLELSFDLLEKNKRDHVDFVIHPWSDISTVNSDFPQPKGKTKQVMIEALFEIYDSWKKQLDSKGIPYYLKIWLYEERFSKSQVVCAIGDKIDFYLNTFSIPKKPRKLDSTKYVSNPKLADFNWEARIDEDFYENNTIGEPHEYKSLKEYDETKRWFEKLLKKPHNIYPLENPTDGCYEFYGFCKGNVWLGERK